MVLILHHGVSVLVPPLCMGHCTVILGLHYISPQMESLAPQPAIKQKKGKVLTLSVKQQPCFLGRNPFTRQSGGSLGLGDGAGGKMGIKRAEPVHLETGEGYSSVRWGYNYRRASLTNCSFMCSGGREVKSQPAGCSGCSAPVKWVEEGRGALLLCWYLNGSESAPLLSSEAVNVF